MLNYLRKLNQDHLAQHPGEHDLTARMQSYELAAGMQVAAKEAMDISQESAATQKMYGIDDKVTQEYGTRCLIARRLVERGVRLCNSTQAIKPGIITAVSSLDCQPCVSESTSLRRLLFEI